MTRRLLNLATVLSLLFCVAAAAIGVRSYWSETLISHTTMQTVGANWYWRMWYVRSAEGYAQLIIQGHQVDSPGFADQWDQRPGSWRWKSQQPGVGGPPVGFPKNLWFELWQGRRMTGIRPDALWSDFHNLRVPLWPVVMLTSVLPVLRLTRSVRRRRARPGLCPACGYDLRASTGLCPECGGPIATTPA